MLGVCVVVQSAINLQRNQQQSCLDIELSFPVSPLQSRVSTHFAAYAWCTTT